MPSPRRSPALLATVLALVVGCGLLVAGVHPGTADDLRRLDRAVLLALRADADGRDPLGPVWLEEAVRDVTALGSVTLLTGMTVAAALYLALQRRRGDALHALLALAGSGALVRLSKLGFSRPRPEVVLPAVRVTGWSFPSGHSLMSTAVFFTLAALLGAQARHQVRRYLLVLAALLAVAVGASRVYLGVHWPTDVAAGWLAGAGWAALCRRARRWSGDHRPPSPG